MLRHSLAMTGAVKRKNLCRDKDFYVATRLGLMERFVLQHEIFLCRIRKFGQGEILGID